jgi:hypothetical protein
MLLGGAAKGRFRHLPGAAGARMENDEQLLQAGRFLRASFSAERTSARIAQLFTFLA